MPTTKPLVDQQTMAQNYGWALSVLRSNPELSKMFDQAVHETWNSNQFVAHLRNTNWYKHHSETNRQNEVLKRADPAEYKRRLEQTRATVSDSYLSMYGHAPPNSLLNMMSSNALQYGYNDAEIHDLVGKTFNYSQQMKKGIGGTLGEAERQIRTAIEDYGLDMGEPWIARQLTQIAQGRSDVTGTANYLQKMAMSKYGAYKDELEQGFTIRDIAEPFKQLMAKTLEMSDKSLSITDPSIQKALTYRAPAKGGKPGVPTSMPLWQFESQLKADPRWNGTQNAQDSIMAAGKKVLADFGLGGGA